MKRFPSALAFVLIGTLIAGVQISGANLAIAGAASDSEKQYLVTYKEADRDF
jgi:hypothetical protein